LTNQNYTLMTKRKLKHSLAFCAYLLATNVPAAGAQVTEIVGSRALGMGGAFVAVASDSSATWWNPAGLAPGPFLDISLGRAVTDLRAAQPARRDTASWFALGTPPFGFSFYRLKITNIRPVDSTVTESGSREDRRAAEPARSLEASQLGITLVQTLMPGIHAGATLKYVRGDLDDRESDGAFGADIGLIATGGPFRAGLLVRNAVESELENGAGVVRLDRQFRAGVAYDAAQVGGPPLVVAADADVSTTADASGDRRNVAVGVERWLWRDRLGLRGGARFNTVGAKQRAATAGLSVALRAGLFLDAHVVGGGIEDDRGWGVAARVSF
jgi:hypothetical protein